jgi:hypothetical protein
MRSLTIAFIAAVTISAAAREDNVTLNVPITFDTLCKITEIPYGDTPGMYDDVQPEFVSIVQQGTAAIPFLIEYLDDPTPTDVVVPLFGGYYAIGDIAMALISEIILNTPFSLFIEDPGGKKAANCGFCVYWDFVRESVKNRTIVKNKTTEWYNRNKSHLKWVPSANMPAGGYYLAKEVS